MSRRSLNMIFSIVIMLVAFAWTIWDGGPPLVPRHLLISDFPVNFGNWTGIRVPIDKKTSDLLNADGVTSILFRNEKSGLAGPEIFFFGIYYDRQVPGKGIHSPENCLPSSGWAVLKRMTIALPLYKGKPPIPASYNIIQKGNQRQLVLYWYQERGRTFSNEYLGRYYMIRDALLMHRTDGAMVRVSMPITTTTKIALSQEVRFLRSLAPLLTQYIPGRGSEKLAFRENFTFEEAFR